MGPLLTAAAVVLAAMSVHAPQAVEPSRRMPDGYRRPQQFTDLAYPADALDARAQGFVVIDLEIDDQGHVSSTRVLAGEPLLAEAAAANAKQWAFEPYAGRTAVVYRFDIDAALCNDDSGGLFRLESPNLASVTTCTAQGRAPAKWPVADLHLVDRPRMNYPVIAESARVQGTVVIKLTLDRNGSVASATGISGLSLLLQPAVVNAKAWKFAPSESREAIIVYEFAFMKQLVSPERPCDMVTVHESPYPNYVRIGISGRCFNPD